MFLVLVATGGLMLRDIRYVIAPGGQMIAVLILSLGLTFMAASTDWSTIFGPPQIQQTEPF